MDDDTSCGIGWSALLTRGGAVVVELASGPADAATGRGVTSATRFQISSVSKPFVATVVASLVENRALAWDGSLARWYPQLPGADSITLHHLLTHTSGIGHWDVVGDHADFARLDDDARIALLARTPPGARPGERWTYSGPGYYLLARIAALTTDQDYAGLLRRTILDPLGLATTTSGRPDPDDTDVALGDHGRDAAPELALATVPGTGDLWSTPADLVRFALALHGGEILGAATVHTMIAAAVDRSDTSPWPASVTAERYGYGCYVGTLAGQPAWFHHGDNPGFRSLLAHVPGRDATVAVLGNSDEVSAWELADRVRSAAG